jgi:hypothetical protein
MLVIVQLRCCLLISGSRLLAIYAVRSADSSATGRQPECLNCLNGSISPGRPLLALLGLHIALGELDRGLIQALVAEAGLNSSGPRSFLPELIAARRLTRVHESHLPENAPALLQVSPSVAAK